MKFQIFINGKWRGDFATFAEITSMLFIVAIERNETLGQMSFIGLVTVKVERSGKIEFDGPAYSFVEWVGQNLKF